MRKYYSSGGKTMLELLSKFFIANITSGITSTSKRILKN